MDKDLQSRRAEGLYQQAGREMEAGRLDKAQLAIRQALALQPRAPAYHRLLGQIYAQQGKAILAQRSFATAKQLEGEAAGADAAPGVSRGPATASFAPAPVTAGAIEAVEMSAGQRHLLIEAAMRCLTRAAATDPLMEQVGLQDTEVYATWREAVGELSLQVRHARVAWRDEQPAVVAASPPPPPPAGAVSEEYQALPPFTHTLGTIAGALSQGPEVMNLQKLLNLEGYHVPISGSFDMSTALAVRKMQEKHGLKKQDGIVNVETRQLFNRLIGQARAVPFARPQMPGIRISAETKEAFGRLRNQPL